jgi:protein Mpv17
LLPRFANVAQVVFGSVIFTPLASGWYGLLAKQFAGSSPANVIAKVGLDQTVWAGAILSSLFVYTSLTEGKGVQDGLQRAKENIWTTMKANWMLWPAVQAFNLGFVPLPYQILVVNCASIPWNTFLAMQTAKASRQRQEKGTLTQAEIQQLDAAASKKK